MSTWSDISDHLKNKPWVKLGEGTMRKVLEMDFLNLARKAVTYWHTIDRKYNELDNTGEQVCGAMTWYLVI